MRHIIQAGIIILLGSAGSVASAFADAAARTDRFGDPLPDGALARLGTIRQRVAATQLAFSPDGRTIITVAAGRSIGFWDTDSGKLRQSRLLPGALTKQFWLSPDGRFVAVAEKNTVAIFDTRSGERKCCLRTLEHMAFDSVYFHSDGKTLATVLPADKFIIVQVWDLFSGEERHRIKGYAVDFRDLAFSPDGKRLFTAGDKHGLKCWNMATAKLVWQNDHAANHLGLSHDGRTLCTNESHQSGLYLWDSNTGRQLGEIDTGKNQWVGRPAFGADGATGFVTDSKDILFWDTAQRKVKHRLTGAGYYFAVAPDGKSLASLNGTLLRRWEVPSGRSLYPETADHGHTDAVAAVAFTPDGRTLVTSGLDRTNRRWDLADLQPRTVLRDVFIRQSGGTAGNTPDRWRTCYFAPQKIAITADGRQFLSENSDYSLRLCDLQTGEELRRFPVRNGDDNVFASAVRLSADCRTLWTLMQRGPDLGSTIQLNKKGTLVGWDLATGERTSANTVAWMGDQEDHVIAPDGRTVALADGSVVGVVGGESRLKEGRGLSYPCVFSADSRLFAAVDLQLQDRWDRIAIQELLTGRPLTRLEMPVSWSSRFAFSLDGRLLIAAGTGALNVWEVSTGRRLLHLPAESRLPGWVPGTFATCLAVAPDGQSAATGHDDGTVLLWDLEPAWKRLAERPTTNLSDDQLDTCWTDLRHDDPRSAYAAMDRLTADPTRTVALLRKQLRPVTIDSQWLQDRLTALDSDNFSAREQASRDLQNIAESIEPRLRRELAKTSSLELRRRLQTLLDQAKRQDLSAETLRQLRALVVLEHIGTPEAQQVLKSLAEGEPSARLTAAAKSALARLAAITKR